MFETIFIAYYAISLSSFAYLMASEYYEHRIIKKEIEMSNISRKKKL